MMVANKIQPLFQYEYDGVNDTVIEKALAPAQKQTVQEFEEDVYGGRSLHWLFNIQRPEIVPAWGLLSRDYYLRRYYRSPYNWLAQGAFTGVVKQFVSTPYEVKAGKRVAAYYQDVLAEAHFGDYGGGWGGFASRVLLDYLTLDFGAVIEVIGGGNPASALTGPVTGLAHLDALRCAATGNPEFPVVYWSRKTNALHKLHHTRVARLVDMPDGDEAYYGLGLSAFSRMISIVEQQVKISKYNIQKLDDLPPAGILKIGGVTPTQWADMRKTYEADRKTDGADTWANTMVVFPAAPDLKIEIESIPFAQTPEHFSYREYIEIHVNAAALALGVDPQDIWPLTGAPLGTGTQSTILHRKAQGKLFGHLLSSFERFINFHVLPDEAEFQFKFEDRDSDRERAEIAKLHTDVATQLVQLHSKEVALQYLADNVESFRDVLLDEAGELIELPDDDPRPEQQPIVAPMQPVAESQTPVTSVEQPATLDSERAVIGLRGTAAGRKDIQAVRLDFEGDLEDALRAAQSGEMTSRRFDTVIRALIRRHGQAAYEEGLKAGGVEDAPSDDDLTAIAKLVAEQTSYVTDLTTSIYDGDVSDTQIEGKPEMWWNKGIMPFYYGGVQSADQNGMYEMVGDDGVESCDTCQALKGQVHRMRDWVRKELVPKIHGENYICGGFKCKHTLSKTSGRASGGWV